MTENNHTAALAAFHHAITHNPGADAPWKALQALTEAVVGVKLFTFMETDMENELSRRAFSSNAGSYPASGSKPINRTHWFDIVHTERRPFVANTIADIATVFPDHQLIWSLGCGSVVNLPILLGDDFVGTLNLLHDEHFYTPARVALIQSVLTAPAQLAYLAAKRQSEKLSHAKAA